MGEMRNGVADVDTSAKFISALQSGDLQALREVPKADLHNHTGCSRVIFQKLTGVNVPPLDHKLHSIQEMEQWVHKNIGSVTDTTEGRVSSFEATFQQAREDGVTILDVGEDVWARDALFGGSAVRMIEILTQLHMSIAPDVTFRPQIGLSRHCSIAKLTEWSTPFFEHDYFKAIDLYTDEFAQPIQNFKPLYRMAKSKGLLLKAHVGEFGDADSVKETVEELELDHVQHGISAAENPVVMNWLADHKIQLNICPTSNIMLSRVESLKVHPIRVLFDHGVTVTVNTDDMLVFGQSVSDEFLNLYHADLFTAEELNIIRLSGLDCK
jgi:adenosine deaminase